MEILLLKNGDSTFRKNGVSTFLHFKMDYYISKWKFYFLRMEILHFKMEILPIFLKIKRTCNFIDKSAVGNVEFTDFFSCDIS